MDWTRIDNSLADPNWYATTEYHEVFKLLRDEDPIHRSEGEKYGRPFWFITRYEDVKDILMRPEEFSSRMHGGRIPRSPKRMTPEERHQLGFDVVVAANDGPIHAMYRRPMNKHFSVPAIARLTDDIDRYVDEIVSDVAAKDEFDLVADVAAELPVRVVLRLLGVPPEDWDELKLAAHMWGTPADPRYTIDGDPVKTAMEGSRRIGEYTVALAQKRRSDPQDDFATIVGNLEVDGDKLSIHEMRSWFFTLIAGGLETTRSAASVGLWAFLQNPDQRAKLLADPSLTKSAVEEVLRWVTPGKNLNRTATEDIEMGGKRIRAGDWVFLALGSANKDERVFTDPHRFDITRTPNEHLGLGEGIHKCLGRSLVRLELALLFPKFLAAFPELEPLEPGEPKWVPDTLATGIREMQMRHHGRIAVPA